jgi:hypothetical protein
LSSFIFIDGNKVVLRCGRMKEPCKRLLYSWRRGSGEWSKVVAVGTDRSGRIQEITHEKGMDGIW